LTSATKRDELAGIGQIGRRRWAEIFERELFLAADEDGFLIAAQILS